MTALPAPIQRALRKHDPAAVPARAVLVGEGWNAAAWCVPSTAGPWLVRVPRVDHAIAEVIRQTALAPTLTAAGIPVPREATLLRNESGEIIAGLYRYVDGSPAPKRGAASLRRLASQVATVVNTLHGLPISSYVHSQATPLRLWPRHYESLIDEFGPTLGPASRAWLADVLAEISCSPLEAAEVCLHGDLAPWHLICDSRGELVAVLDVLGPHYGDPAIDFGRLVQHWGMAFAEDVLTLYAHPVDAHFRGRMALYGLLEPLKSVSEGHARGEPRWVKWGRRKLASHASHHPRRT